MSLNHNLLACGLLALLISACQTTPAPQAMRAPEAFQEAFSQCNKGDGEVLARLLEGEQVINTVPMDWVAWGRRGWAVEGTSPFGQTLFRLTYQGVDRSFATSGAFPGRLPDLASNEDGYLVIDGRWIGIRASEIPCFLKGQVPTAWLQSVIHWKLSSHELVFTSKEKGRALYVRMEVDEQNSINYCSRIVWSYYLGLVSRELKICSSNILTSFSGYQNYRLELERSDGI